MRKIIAALLMLGSSIAYGSEFVHPKKFDGSDAHKEKVINYIKERVQKDYCQTIDMCQEAMLRMMESENLDAFKRLTSAQNDRILDRAIHDYCNTVDMCSYQMIEMMYNENTKAELQELKW